LETNRNEAQAWLSLAEGKNDEAVSLLRSIAEKQDAFGKGEVEPPAREMLADMLLEMGQLAEALAEYEKSSKTDPNRFNALYGAGHAAELALQTEKAAGFYEQLVKSCGSQTPSSRSEIIHARAFLAGRNTAPGKQLARWQAQDQAQNEHAVIRGKCVTVLK
jgi:tetratricopeptide (TPR) repeat protein